LFNVASMTFFCLALGCGILAFIMKEQRLIGAVVMGGLRGKGLSFTVGLGEVAEGLRGIAGQVSALPPEIAEYFGSGLTQLGMGCERP
jgi:hypothetical protein